MKTSEEMIDDLVDAVNDWDIDTLVNFVQYYLRSQYKQSPPELIKKEWDIYCNTEEEEEFIGD